jgi:hypothetical protein
VEGIVVASPTRWTSLTSVKTISRRLDVDEADMVICTVTQGEVFGIGEVGKIQPYLSIQK